MYFRFSFLKKQYLDIIESKTENSVPIVDKLRPFYKDWYESCLGCESLLHTENGNPLSPAIIMTTTRHRMQRRSEVSFVVSAMLSEAGVPDTTIKK